MSSRPQEINQNKTHREKWMAEASASLGFRNMRELAQEAKVNEGDLSAISRGTQNPSNLAAKKLIQVIQERNAHKGWSYSDAAHQLQDTLNFLRSNFANQRGDVLKKIKNTDVERWHLNQLNQAQAEFDKQLVSIVNLHLSDIKEQINNLAKTYSSRIRGDQAEKIEQIIADCKKTLTEIDRETIPIEWAQAMNNLAEAYSSRIRGDRRDNIKRAITAYKQALTVITQDAMPSEWASINDQLAYLHQFEVLETDSQETLTILENSFSDSDLKQLQELESEIDSIDMRISTKLAVLDDMEAQSRRELAELAKAVTQS